MIIVTPNVFAHRGLAQRAFAGDADANAHVAAGNDEGGCVLLFVLRTRARAPSPSAFSLATQNRRTATMVRSSVPAAGSVQTRSRAACFAGGAARARRASQPAAKTTTIPTTTTSIVRTRTRSRGACHRCVCPGARVLSLCPAGRFCPNATYAGIECPSGQYCPTAVHRPVNCPAFSSLGYGAAALCPDKGQTKPYVRGFASVMVLMCAALIGVTSTFWGKARAQLREYQLVRLHVIQKQDKEERAVQTQEDATLPRGAEDDFGDRASRGGSAARRPPATTAAARRSSASRNTSDHRDSCEMTLDELESEVRGSVTATAGGADGASPAAEEHAATAAGGGGGYLAYAQSRASALVTGPSGGISATTKRFARSLSSTTSHSRCDRLPPPGGGQCHQSGPRASGPH